MKISEITRAHWDEFYTELPGVRADHAPYIVRKITTDDGVYYKVFLQSHEVASARLSQDGEYVMDLSVQPQHQRRGVATALYAYIEAQLGHPLKPSPLHQTEPGKAFWHSRR